MIRLNRELYNFSSENYFGRKKLMKKLENIKNLSGKILNMLVKISLMRQDPYTIKIKKKIKGYMALPQRKNLRI